MNLYSSCNLKLFPVIVPLRNQGRIYLSKKDQSRSWMDICWSSGYLLSQIRKLYDLSSGRCSFTINLVMQFNVDFFVVPGSFSNQVLTLWYLVFAVLIAKDYSWGCILLEIFSMLFIDLKPTRYDIKAFNMKNVTFLSRQWENCLLEVKTPNASGNMALMSFDRVETQPFMGINSQYLRDSFR